MATIREMLNRVAAAREGIEPAMMDIINKASEKIIDLNRMQQLFEGKNTKGQIIGRYSITTEQAYGGAAKGKFAGEPYNFEDTGDLFKAFTLEFDNGKLEIFSTDSKVTLLQEKYGNDLFGLTWEHEMELNYEIIKPELVRFIKRVIYG